MTHKVSCMLNLTYDDAHLPRYGQLLKSDLQKFFKRLRKNTGPFRYVASGEYGDHSRRPHFHIALFGMDFASDRVRFGSARGGDPTFISGTVQRSWDLGNHLIGSLNFESAAYIARYIVKKLKGAALAKPLACDPDTGELVMPNPEFLVMSKGIGRAWFRDYFMSDVFPHASVITSQGTKAPVPRFYKTLLKEVGEDLSLDMSFRSTVRGDLDRERQAVENSSERKATRERVAVARSKRSRRLI